MFVSSFLGPLHIDPQSRRHILDSVKELNRAGMTVLYTTHYMEEVEEIAHHIAIVDQGKVVALGTRAELVKLVGGHDRVVCYLWFGAFGLCASGRTRRGCASAHVDHHHDTRRNYRWTYPGEGPRGNE